LRFDANCEPRDGPLRACHSHIPAPGGQIRGQLALLHAERVDIDCDMHTILLQCEHVPRLVQVLADARILCQRQTTSYLLVCPHRDRHDPKTSHDLARKLLLVHAFIMGLVALPVLLSALC